MPYFVFGKPLHSPLSQTCSIYNEGLNSDAARYLGFPTAIYSYGRTTGLPLTLHPLDLRRASCIKPGLRIPRCSPPAMNIVLVFFVK